MKRSMWMGLLLVLLAATMTSAQTISGFAGTNRCNGCAPAIAHVDPRGADAVGDGLWWADTGAHQVCTASPTSNLIQCYGQAWQQGFAGDGGPIGAPGVLFSSPLDVEVQPDGSVLIADSLNNRIRKMGTDGILSTVATIPVPQGLCGSGTDVYVAQGFTPGVVTRLVKLPNTLIAGGGNTSPADGVPALQANLGAVIDCAVGQDGTVYFSDGSVPRVWKIDAAGVLRKVLDNLTVSSPAYLSLFPPTGTLYVTDALKRRVFAVDVTSGTVVPLVGSGAPGRGGDGGPAALAQLVQPESAVRAGNRLYVTDFGAQSIRVVDLGAAPPTATTVATTPTAIATATFTRSPTPTPKPTVCHTAAQTPVLICE